MLRFLPKLFLFCMLVAAIQASISLQISIDSNSARPWQCLRARAPEVYVPTPQVLSIQNHSQAHPKLGFLWKADLGKHETVEMAWDDGEVESLYSDRWGFANSPDAIADLETGKKVDIVGIGASYMGGAQALFYEYFGFKGQFYYNLAHGRFTMPQFNAALRDYALLLKPQTIVYGLNEVSYLFIDDFQEWIESGIDWFTYHSGTWCGPVIGKGILGGFLQKHSRVHGVWNAAAKKLWWGASKPASRREKTIRKTFHYIYEAYNDSRDAGIDFVVLFIPSRQTAMAGPDAPSKIFDKMVPLLKKHGIPYIDTRHDFGSVEDPQGLYFVYDDHWNRQGIYRAARALASHLEERAGGVLATK